MGATAPAAPWPPPYCHSGPEVVEPGERREEAPRFRGHERTCAALTSATPSLRSAYTVHATAARTSLRIPKTSKQASKQASTAARPLSALQLQLRQALESTVSVPLPSIVASRHRPRLRKPACPSRSVACDDAEAALAAHTTPTQTDRVHLRALSPARPPWTTSGRSCSRRSSTGYARVRPSLAPGDTV
jgi:hypothetical protein